MGMFSDIDYSLIVLQLEKAMANGVATLNSSAKVPTNQISLTASDVGAIASTGNGVLTTLNAASGTISASVLPSYVDDVLNFPNLAAFPVAGDAGKIYVTEDNNKVYRWSGSVYVEISSSATAGEALKLTNARTISTTGDATYSISFDGSANVSSAITLANTGVTAGTYNALATQVRPFTVNAKGLITGTGAAVDITPPWSAITGKPTTLDGFGIIGGTVTGDLVSTSATASTSPTTGAIRAASLGITGAIFAQNLYTTGNVGIGASGVLGGEKVAITNTSSGAGTVGLNLINNSMTDNTAISLDFTPNVNIALARINALRTNASGVTDLVFLNYNGSVLGETMRIKENGNVGIGTANPSQKLDVDGSAKATSFFVGTNQVVSSRKTGWSAPTGTATRTTFATSTVTLPQLAERVKALIDDLTTHGLIGA